jgi:hypothetical protein
MHGFSWNLHGSEKVSSSSAMTSNSTRPSDSVILMLFEKLTRACSNCTRNHAQCMHHWIMHALGIHFFTARGKKSIYKFLYSLFRLFELKIRPWRVTISSTNVGIKLFEISYRCTKINKPKWKCSVPKEVYKHAGKDLTNINKIM